MESGRTISEITLLESADRVREIARMLGGQTDTARQHARELLAQAET
jgi:DNA repair ATPase RecN